MPNENGWTPTQQRMIDLLSDGMPHDRHELHACLDDPLSSLATIKFHLSLIRRIIRLRGEDIICELWERKIHYRHVRLLVWDAQHAPTSPQRLTPSNSRG